MFQNWGETEAAALEIRADDNDRRDGGGRTHGCQGAQSGKFEVAAVRPCDLPWRPLRSLSMQFRITRSSGNPDGFGIAALTINTHTGVDQRNPHNDSRNEQEHHAQSIAEECNPAWNNPAAREGDTRKGQQILASEMSRMTDHIDRWASQIGRNGDPHKQLAW